jgi:uncharacterized protein YcbK (DUF882 family)
MNVLLVKDGVTPKNLVIAAAAANVASELGCTIMITSGTDGVHKVGSFHYTGEALDFRLPPVPIHLFVAAMQQHLGRAYQVIVETDHIHVEYDPKRKNP